MQQQRLSTPGREGKAPLAKAPELVHSLQQMRT